MAAPWSSNIQVDEKAFRKRQEERFPQHTCELPLQPDRVYPLLPPNASCWMRFKMFYQRQVTGWPKWLPLRILRPSTYAVEMEVARHIRSSMWWVIHPYSRFWVFWQLLQIASIILTLILAPVYHGLLSPTYYLKRYQVTDVKEIPFIDKSDPLYDEFERERIDLKTKFNNALVSLKMLFIVHIALQFVTGYYDEESNEIVMQPRKIARHYVCGWFILDSLSVLDFQVLRSDVISLKYFEDAGTTFEQDRFRFAFWEVHVLLVLLRVHYVVTYTNNWALMCRLRPASCSGITFAICFFTYIQWASYLNYRIPMLARGIYLFMPSSRSWQMDPELAFFDLTQPHLLFRQYLICVFRVLRVESKCKGYTAYNELTLEDRILLVMMIWIGSAFKIVLIVIILRYIQDHNASEEQLVKVMSQLQVYMRHKHLPHPLRYKIMLYYGSYFYRGSTDRFFNERLILQNLPLSIQNEIRRSDARHLINTSHIFKGLPKAVVSNIVNELYMEMLMPNDAVYKSGESAGYLYLLKSGTVGVFLATGEEVGHLEDGACFGEMGLVLREHRARRVESVVALEVSEIFCMDAAAFKRVVMPLPRVYNRIRTAAMIRASEVVPMSMDAIALDSMQNN